ncbi:dicarboxylate/amino acid:cation symporter [Williamwhitmania taraxaci]|uniref:Na+/H+-dicarboxylate symporter n=1 Tax=Williamwhitmania taraxaci TaxID=1640674 RepID=A0A1G6HIG0_9BACT|nr:dicarboxylate/amino acid:cation symporter [Williamwhitmania taraxaci]SDB93933.1 Na+/H+-dicarboxylate symporter [Williamwhitmania taraxaci]
MGIKKMPLYTKILLGMGLGLVWGIIAVWLGATAFSSMWIKPFGVIFLNLLKLIAIPLIFVSLVKGISSLSDISRLSSIGVKTLSIYIVTTVLAVSIGLIVVNIVNPGSFFPQEKRAELIHKYSTVVEEKKAEVKKVKDQSPLAIIVDMVPENVISAASDNRNMLQVILFAALFGVALALTKGTNTGVVINFFDGLNDVILKIIDIIMLFAPIGVFALLGSLIVDFAGESISSAGGLFVALGLYSLTVIIGLFFILLIVYPILIRIFGKMNPLFFLKGIFPAQLVAFSSSSSAATLPVTMEQVERELKVPKEICSFVLPVGSTVNMDGTSLYQAVAAVFIAQVFGIELSMTQQLTIVFTAVLASIGAAGVPGAGIIMLLIVLNSVGIPPEGLALILAVDRPLDMLRTVVNVTGDAMVSVFVARSEKLL